MGWVVNATPRPLYSQERPGTYCAGGWVGPHGRPGQMQKISSPAGIRSPDIPARNQSLHRLRYPGSQKNT